MGSLICIIGADGSGKTTQAKLLLKYLIHNNIPSKYVWLRFFHLFSLPVLFLMKLLNLSYSITTPSGKKVGYHLLWNNRIISALYQTTLLIDIFLYKIYKIDFSRRVLSKTVVCDRFIFDTIVDLMIATKNENIITTLPGNILTGMIPKDTIAFLLRTDYNVLIGRRDDVKADINLLDRMNYYEKLNKIYNFRQLDANDSESNIAKEILKVLQNEQIV